MTSFTLFLESMLARVFEYKRGKKRNYARKGQW